jgi:hypothetical protein
MNNSGIVGDCKELASSESRRRLATIYLAYPVPRRYPAYNNWKPETGNPQTAEGTLKSHLDSDRLLLVLDRVRALFQRLSNNCLCFPKSLYLPPEKTQ